MGGWVNAEQARAIKEWRRQFRGEPRVRQDRLLTDAEIAEHNLVLWGDPQQQPDAAPAWPTSCPSSGARRASRSASRRFPADSHALIAIYPNPLNPGRYVVLNSGFTFREYDYLNNARQTPKLPDWAVVDTRTPARRPRAGQGGGRRLLRRALGAAAGEAPGARDRNQGGRGGRAVIAGRLAMIAALSGAVACSDLGKPAVISPERPATPDAASNRPPPPPEPDAAAPPGFGLPDVPPASDAGDTAAAPGQTMDVVYAHSGSDLFRVDPSRWRSSASVRSPCPIR